MTRKKYLWIPLTLMLIASIAMISVPVKSDPYETRLYIRESPPGGWIPGEDVDQEVWATVDIESPIAWDNTEYGIVGYVFSVHVDPDVLTPLGAFGADLYYFLFDFIDWNYMGSAYYPEMLVTEINGTTGDLIEVGELIKSFPDLGVGAGGNSTDTDAVWWYGEINGLARLRFKSKTATGSTPIDIYDAYWVDINETMHAFDVVDDGQYNQEPVYLTVESIPFDGIDFTLNPTYTTNTTIELQPGTYTVTMPVNVAYDGDLFIFEEWEDASTNPARSISIASNMTIIANYTYGGPPLEANLKGRSAWREHAHFDVSKHGNISVTDPKGTDGYQTLFAKIMNIGEGNVTVKATFRVYKGDADLTLTTAEQEIEPGQIVVLTVDFAGADGYPWEDTDLGIWRVETKCLYYQPGVGWLTGVKVKTFKFSVVP